MLVETPAMNMAVDVRSVETDDQSMTLSGLASTMPCKVVVSRDELGQLFRLLANWRVIKFVLCAMFTSAPK